MATPLIRQWIFQGASSGTQSTLHRWTCPPHQPHPAWFQAGSGRRWPATRIILAQVPPKYHKVLNGKPNNNPTNWGWFIPIHGNIEGGLFLLFHIVSFQSKTYCRHGLTACDRSLCVNRKWSNEPCFSGEESWCVNDLVSGKWFKKQICVVSVVSLTQADREVMCYAFVTSTCAVSNEVL